MQCPKCGRSVERGAFICPGCEFILDTSFLGDDITDDDHEKRVALNKAKGLKGSKSGEFGEDAIILGDGQGEYSDFSSRDAGGLTREVTQARFYIGGSTAALLHPDAVPEVSPAAVQGSLKMSPFEQHVLGFINGKRSIGRIQKKSAMEDSEFKVAVSMLADKGIIRLRTTKKKKKNGSASMPSRSESAIAAPRPESSGGDRTVVAAFPGFPEPGADDDDEATAGKDASLVAAAAALDDVIETRAEIRGSRTSAAEATIIKTVDPAKKQSRMPGFASMRIQEEAAPPVVDEARADAWGEENPNNISNVFARATPSAPRPKSRLADSVPPPPSSQAIPPPAAARSVGPSPPPLPDDFSDDDVELRNTGSFEEAPADDVDALAERDARADAAVAGDDVMPDEMFVPPGGDDDVAGFFDKAPTGPNKPVQSRAPAEDARDLDLPLALRDPTGMGDVVDKGRGAGAPIDDEADDSVPPSPADSLLEDDSEQVDVGDVPDHTEARPAGSFEDATGEPGLRSDEPTGPLPDDDDGDAPGVHARSTANDNADAGGDADDDGDDGDRDDGDDGDGDAGREEPPLPEGDDEGFDVDLATRSRPGLHAAQTASLPDLPSDALKPLPGEPPPPAKFQPMAPPVWVPAGGISSVQPPPPSAGAIAAPIASPPPTSAQRPGAIATQAQPEAPAITLLPLQPSGAPAPKLPGQSMVASMAGVPGMPGQQLQRSAPGVPGLPGQSLQVKPAPGAAPSGGPVRPPTQVGGTKGGLQAPRPSAGSKVPFEQARKAEKIFEQAVKDHSEGRLSSARMNAKLAVMYDPTVETYAEFLKELDAKGADAKPPGGGKSRELQLFEAASEAEGSGDYDKAVDLLEQAVSINPKAAALRNRLGVVLSIRLKRHVEAMEQLKIAIDLEPGNIVYMNNFSKVTALLDSQLEKDPHDKKKRGTINEKVAIKKMRPKLF